MKTLTITALMATLVAIPLLVHIHRAQGASGRERDAVPDDPRRYDIFDFVS